MTNDQEGVLKKARRIQRSQGWLRLVTRTLAGLRHRCANLLSRHLRPHLPVVRYLRYNGVEVPRHRRRGDTFLKLLGATNIPPDKPTYEAALVEGLNEHVRPGDEVVIVGGGWGVTAVVAANLAGPRGHVVVYEGSREMLPVLHRTLDINDASGTVEVVEGVVGPNMGVYGGSVDDNQVPVTDLPACDILELDCEGSELDILEGMTHRPRAILVETHGLFGAPEDAVSSVLKRRSYDVANLGVAEPEKQRFCEENGIYVLAAHGLT